MPIQTPQKYEILDNGGTPFIVYDYGNKIIICNTAGSELFNFPYIRIFIGDNEAELPNHEHRGVFRGNSILIEQTANTYIYIGPTIMKFMAKNNENIVEFYSPVGNSCVPYTYAIGEIYTYLFQMNTITIVPNKLLDFESDVFAQYYGWQRYFDANVVERAIHSRQIPFTLLAPRVF